MRPAQQPRPKPRLPLPVAVVKPLRCIECGELMLVDKNGRPVIKGLCLNCLLEVVVQALQPRENP